MPPAVRSANSNLSKNQLSFLAGFVKSTGMDPTVAAAWMRNEEPNLNQNTDPSGHGAYNFLNIGITGSGNYGAGEKHWRNPTQAGQFTGEWMKGNAKVPNFGHSSSGIQNIMKSVGGSAQDQISAIQHSGWAAGGETALPGLYSSFKSQGGAQAPTHADLTTWYRATATPGGGQTAKTPPVTTPAAIGPKSTADKATATTLGLPALGTTPTDTGRSALLSFLMAQQAYATSSPQQQATSAPPSLLGALQSGAFNTPMTTAAPQAAAPTAAKVPAAKAPTSQTPAAAPTTDTPAPVKLTSAEAKKVGNFEGTKVMSWMVPALQYARQQGWKGTLSSGIRSTALQATLWKRYQDGGNIAARPGHSNHEIQNGGAFDATDPEQLHKILEGYKGQRPIWAKSVGLNDNPHFSINGH